MRSGSPAICSVITVRWRTLGYVERTFVQGDDSFIIDPSAQRRLYRRAPNCDSEPLIISWLAGVMLQLSWQRGLLSDAGKAHFFCSQLLDIYITPACRQNRNNCVASSVEKKLRSLRLSGIFLINSSNSVEPFDIKNCIFHDSSNLSHWMDACICTSPTLILCDSEIGPCSFVLRCWKSSFVSICPFNCQSVGTKVCNILFPVFKTLGAKWHPAVKETVYPP